MKNPLDRISEQIIPIGLAMVILGITILIYPTVTSIIFIIGGATLIMYKFIILKNRKVTVVK